MNEQPTYKHPHDKSCCIFLGQTTAHRHITDLYFCKQNGTIIARYSDIPTDFTSGEYKHVAELVVARQRAVERGLLYSYDQIHQCLGRVHRRTDIKTQIIPLGSVGESTGISLHQPETPEERIARTIEKVLKSKQLAVSRLEDFFPQTRTAYLSDGKLKNLQLM